MPQKHQVNFRVTDSFLNRIKSECIKREISLQELITNALKLSFQIPPHEWDQGMLYTYEEDKSEQSDWLSLWERYFSKMPREKVLLMVEVMKLDLRHYKSSRRKADLKKHQGRPKDAGKQKRKVKNGSL